MIIGNLPVEPSDLVRQLVNLAVNCGRSLQSSQTGFVHYCYRVLDYSSFDTIPIYENYLFALALLRERTAETFAEGKALIEKLQHFQDEDGNFPVYLHEYPECKDRNVAVNLLPIFYWVLRTFPVVLGAPSRDSFQKTAEKAFDYCIKLHEENLPFLVSLKIACGVKALANLWNKKDIENRADEWLDALHVESESPNFSGWFIPEVLGEAIISLEMVYGGLGNSPWKGLFEHLRAVWHYNTASYVGPGLRDYQFKEQPEVTLLDLIAGFHAGAYAYRALLNGPHMLQCALIHPSAERIVSKPGIQQGMVSGRRWFLNHGNDWAFSLLEKLQPDPSRDNAYSAFRFLWGDYNCAHSFACQGGSADKVEFHIADGGVDLLFHLPQEVPGEAKQRNREIIFCLDCHEEISFVVGSIGAATTFQLGESVAIRSGDKNFSLKLLLEEGSGQFFGHISKGNRASQKHTTGDGRFKSYDWQLFLRTVERQPGCVIRAEIRF